MKPGALDAPAVRRHDQPVRELVDGDDGEAPEQEHEPAEPELGRDDERRPVAPRPPGRRTRRRPATASSASATSTRAREQHPAAGAVERARPASPTPRHHPLARLQRAPPRRLRRRRRWRRADALEQAALAEVGQQPREPRRPRRPEPPLGLARSARPPNASRRAAPAERASIVAEAQERAALEVAQHPPPAALGRLEALERVAGPHPRRPGPAPRRPARGSCAPPRPRPWALDQQLGVARAAAARRRAARARPVTRTPSTYVPASEPASSHPLAVGRDPRMTARHRRIAAARPWRPGRARPSSLPPAAPAPPVRAPARARPPAGARRAGGRSPPWSCSSRLRATRDGDQPAAARHQHQRAGRKAEERDAGALVGHAAGAGGDAAPRHAVPEPLTGTRRRSWTRRSWTRHRRRCSRRPEPEPEPGGADAGAGGPA